MKKYILSIFLLLISMYSFAIEVKYVGVKSAPVREYANASMPIIGKIPYGKKVYVHYTSNEWSGLADVKDTNQRWVNSNDLCDVPNCKIKQNKPTNTVKKTITPTPKANKLKKSVSANHLTKPTKAKKRKIYYSSGCPCGYGYCYGPRGGRFCITSGGNKSYR